jgi:hypothetical protein
MLFVQCSGGILHHRREVSKLSTMNGKPSFVKVSAVITMQLVLTRQFNLYLNNYSRIPTEVWIGG